MPPPTEPAAPRVFRDLPAILVESLFWDARTAEMVWVDITAGTLHFGRLDDAVDGSDDRVVRLPPPASAVQPATGDGFVAALRDTVVLLDAEGAVTRTLASVSHTHGGIRFNEGKVDPFGRFLVGSMNTTTGIADAALHRVGPDGDIRLLRGGFGTANGMEWSDDGRTLYVTDTATRTVYRAPYGPGDDDLGEFEPFLVGRMSDGLARADDGTFWNGIYGGGCVVHWSAAGEELGEIAVPAPNVTSVAFGGPDADTLFVGTAREQLVDSDLEEWPRSGSVLRIDGIGHGRPVHVFGETTTTTEGL